MATTWCLRLAGEIDRKLAKPVRPWQCFVMELLDRITVEPGKCGGRPCIRGLRIRVKDIVQWYDLLKMDADEIAAAYDLELADIFAALAYYYHNRVMLQETWAKEELLVEELRKEIPSKIKRVVDGSN